MIKIIDKLLPKNRNYYLAVSMGADSVAALFWLRWKNYNFIPLHFNHNIRAQNGTMQEKFLELSHELNLNGISEVGINLKTENDCRNARLNFYSKYAQNGTIITAHHLNDWVESYLLNCFRGKPNVKPFSLESKFENFTIIHPFLLSRKSDFKQFLERNNWTKWIVQDESNFLIKGSRRNWIRNNIINEMRKQKLSLEKYALRKIKEEINKTLNEIKQ